MQGLADGYFVIPYTLAHYLGGTRAAGGHDRPRRVQRCEQSVQARIDRLLLGERRRDPAPNCTASSAASSGTTSGWPATTRGCAGPSRDPAAARGVLAERVGAGPAEQPEQEPRVRRARGRLPRVRRVCSRSTPCNAPSRAAATSARKARRPTAKRCATTRSSRYVAAWEFKGVGKAPTLHKEPLDVRIREAVAAELQVRPNQPRRLVLVPS